MKKQVNVRLSEYDLELIEKIKKYFSDRDYNTTDVIEFCIFTTAYHYGLKDDFVK